MHILYRKKIAICLLCFFVSIIGILCKQSWIACIIYFGVALYFAYLNNVSTIVAFLVLAVFQNIVLIIFSDFLSPAYNNILSLMKELMLYMAVIFGFFRFINVYSIKEIFEKHKKFIFLSALFIIIILKNVLFTTAEFMSVLVTIRQLLVPVVCFFVGFFLKSDKKSFEKILNTIIFLALFMVIIGVIDMLLPQNVIWEGLDYGKYLANKQEGAINLYKGVTVNFYTWDLGFIMRRLVSITADPLATAHLMFLGFAIIICYSDIYVKIKGRIIYLTAAAMLFLGCVLAFSKGIIIYILILLAAIFYNKYNEKIPKRIIITIISVLATVCVIAVAVLYLTADSPTAITNHIDGLFDGLKGGNLFGNGLGTAGAVNSTITGNCVANAESYFGVVLNQIGYFGTAILLFIWVVLFIKFMSFYLKNKSMINFLPIILIVGLSIDMFFSESSVSITGTGIYFILIGIYYRFHLYDNVNNKNSDISEINTKALENKNLAK